jgi:hypothetical protein
MTHVQHRLIRVKEQRDVRSGPRPEVFSPSRRALCLPLFSHLAPSYGYSLSLLPHARVSPELCRLRAPLRLSQHVRGTLTLSGRMKC